MKIETKRLSLYPISDDEMRHLIESQESAELRQAYGEMLQGCIDHPEKRMWYAVWVMELKEKPGTIVGDFCFKGLGEDGTVEIGYGLRDGFCGNGYMTEALKAVSEWALSQEEVKEIIAETAEENEASKKVLQRCGFRFSGRHGEEGPLYCRKAPDIFETERLTLRPWKESDAEVLFRYASDPDLGPRAGWPPHQSVEESLTVIRTYFLNDSTWAVVFKETGGIVGCAGYHPSSRSNLSIAEDEAEVGYWIAKPYWNRGLCTEALRAVVGHCFRTKGFNTLLGSHFTGNPASGRVMEKCGFSDTGRTTTCPNLEVGYDQPVKILHLKKEDWI